MVVSKLVSYNPFRGRKTQRTYIIRCFPKIGVLYPNMDGENNGKLENPIKMDDLGGTTILGNSLTKYHGHPSRISWDGFGFQKYQKMKVLKF